MIREFKERVLSCSFSFFKMVLKVSFLILRKSCSKTKPRQSFNLSFNLQTKPRQTKPRQPFNLPPKKQLKPQIIQVDTHSIYSFNLPKPRHSFNLLPKKQLKPQIIQV